jgi:predicted transglutaminase-like cysteine proteinase
MSSGYTHRTKIHSGYSGNRLVSAVLAAILVIGAIVLSAFPVYAAGNSLTGGNQVGSADISPFTKWTSVLPRYEQQYAEAASMCIGEGCLNQKWEALLTELAGKPAQEQIAAVNSFFNGMKYISDQDNYGVADYWNTPYELMARGGDCEDYAIAKYISLKRLGVAENAMRIIIVHDQSLGGELHAILEVKTADATLILDNQSAQVLPVANVVHYQPIYAINETKWWAYR